MYRKPWCKVSCMCWSVFSVVQKVPGVNKCGVKVVWRDLEDHPSWSEVINHGIPWLVSPPSRVVPLPNGLYKGYKWLIHGAY